MKMDFKLPTYKERLTVIGRTGSGKTVFGVHMLSLAPFDRQPYIVVDYKGDELIADIDRIRDIGLKEKLPRAPGLYRVAPMPGDEEGMEDWLWKVWEHEKLGLFFDEAYSLPKSGNSQAFRSILTQGRSKRIPAIVLTQRPAWLSQFVFSEADHYSMFRLNSHEDEKTVKRFVPKDKVDLSGALPEFHSYWYDVKRDNVFFMRPAPPSDIIVDRIQSRLSPTRRTL